MRAVNLLPADLRGAVKAPAPVNPVPEDGGGSGAFFALGALALSALALAAFVLTTNTIKQREADLAALETRSQAVLAETARLKPYADFETLATARVATVRDLASQRFDWEASFRDLSRALPEDVTVNALAGTISNSAGGSNPLRSAINVPAIELTGCTSDQPAVARMMARLRAVDGVTRVSLANAVKIEGTDTPAADAAASAGVAPTGCEGKGKSDPADFNVVAFFEGDAVASSEPGAPTAPSTVTGAGTAAGTGSGTPAATPTPAPSADQPAPTTEASGTSVPTDTETK